ncbi:MAG: amidohydrolase family protein [Deltaproteobacteria bacterium]|nr:amidohydrolase family protein [Deltaproteobacteria bacterium]
MTSFRNVVLGDKRVDLGVRDGRIAWITPTGASPRAADGEEAVAGGMITPHLAEPHVHLDATLLGARKPNRTGTLREGIANWAELRPELTADDVIARSRETIARYRHFGCTRIRTHVDTGSAVAVEALVSLRESVRSEGIDLQIVAFPQEGILRGPGRREAWIAAVESGCDAVGAIPHFERTTEEGWQSVRLAFQLAEKHGLRLDFHCDETDDPGSRNLEVVCAETMDRGLAGRVVAGHCTALHSYPNPYAAKVVELVAASGVQVVTNPLDNVVLQGRYDTYPRRRGLTRVDALWAAGATVGIGHDSVQDPWYPLGTANLMDAAYMLVHLGQLMSRDELARAARTLWTENHLPFGDVPRIEEGGPAKLLWWPAEDEVALLRERPVPRVFG